MTLVLLVLAGAVGAVLRYEVERAVRRRSRSDLPVGILLVNVSGSFALGMVVGLAEHLDVPSLVVTVVGTGLLGAYTTFSTFSVDTVALAERGRVGAAAANVGVSLVAGLAAAALGLALGHLL